MAAFIEGQIADVVGDEILPPNVGVVAVIGADVLVIQRRRECRPAAPADLRLLAFHKGVQEKLTVALRSQQWALLWNLNSAAP